MDSYMQGWMTKRIAKCDMHRRLPDMVAVLEMDLVYNAGMQLECRLFTCC
jgi:hypothetical protein